MTSLVYVSKYCFIYGKVTLNKNILSTYKTVSFSFCPFPCKYIRSELLRKAAQDSSTRQFYQEESSILILVNVSFIESLQWRPTWGLVCERPKQALAYSKAVLAFIQSRVHPRAS